MTGAAAWALYSLATCSLVAAIGIVRARQMIEWHMRKQHPVLATELFPPPLPVSTFPTVEEEARNTEVNQRTRYRFKRFVKSGEAARLQDAKLNQLLRIERISLMAAFSFAALLIAFVVLRIAA